MKPSDVYYEAIVGFSRVLAEETGGQIKLNDFLGALATFVGQSIGTVPGRELRQSLCAQVNREIVAAMKKEAKSGSNRTAKVVKTEHRGTQ